MNTKFFHSKASKHFKKNRIRRLEDPSGSWIMKDKDITKEVQHYFNDVFQTIAPSAKNLSRVIHRIGSSVSEEIRQQLDSPFTRGG